MSPLRDQLRRSFDRLVPDRRPSILAGWVALALAVALTLVARPTFLSVVLGVVAVAGLSSDKRYGVLPAAMLVMIAVPYGRAADNDLPALAGVPLRFHDGAVAAAVALSFPALRRLTLRPALVRASLLWVVIGIGAIVVGLLEGTPARDIARDARWWFLYAFVAVALWSGTRRSNVIRAVVVGATIFTIVLFAAAILPAFDGGLKERAISYDRGLLRLQFSNAVFVIVAAAWLVDRLLRRPAPINAAWFALLAGGVLLSLTRASIYMLVGVVVLSVVLAIRRGLARQGRRAVRRASIVAALLAVPVVLAVGALSIGTGDLSAGGSPFDRLFFQAPNSGLDSIARGRGETYLAALAIIAESPVVGQGMGTLVEFGFTPGGSRPATPGMQPGVDNAYQTVAIKAGVVGAAAFVILFGWPLVELMRRPRDRHRTWFGIAWLAVLGLTLTQSFATTGYGPYELALLIAFISLRPLPAGPAGPGAGASMDRAASAGAP